MTIHNKSKYNRIPAKPEKGYIRICGYGSLMNTASAKRSLPSMTNFTLAFLNGFKRQALHAQYLSFVHPTSKSNKSFFIDMPNDMLALRNQLVAEFE